MESKLDNFQRVCCRLCLDVISSENVDKISNVTEDILNILLLKLNLDKNKHVMCRICALKVREALKFKSMCICTENTIIPYVDNITGSSIGLLEIYAEEKKDKQLIHTLHDHKVCRLCMQLIQGQFKSMNQVETDAIEKYIPEMKISVIEDPVVCIPCFKSLATYSSFIKNCLEVEEKIKSYYGGSGCPCPSSISASELCIKDEDIVIKEEVIEDQDEFTIEPLKEDDEYKIRTECIDIKSEEYNESETIPRDSPTLLMLIHEEHAYSKDHISTHKRNSVEPEEDIKRETTLALEKSLQDNQLDEKTRTSGVCDKSDFESPLMKDSIHSEIQTYKCLCCRQETIWKRTIRGRNVPLQGNILADPQENSSLKMHKCDKCNSKTLHKFSCYQLTPKVDLYKCDKCNFKTKHRNCLGRHQLKHKDPSQVRMYKCDKCSYKSKFKADLKKHELKHKDPSQLQMYKCEKCDYESKYKETWRKHQLKHSEPSQVQMYKCDKCNYKTKYSHCLKTHQLKHKDPSQITMYECDKCDYKTRYRHYLTDHQLKHKDASQVKIYKCDKCNFKTKYGQGLKRHQLVHKDCSQVPMYECGKCDFKTKYERHIKKHKLRFTSLSEEEMYQCGNCSFVTKYRCSLKRHHLSHKEPSHGQTYKCNKCSFQAKDRNYIKIHQLMRHKNPSGGESV